LWDSRGLAGTDRHLLEPPVLAIASISEIFDLATTFPELLYTDRMADATREDDERLTTVGLLFESAAGLRRLFERSFESDRTLSAPSFDVLIRLARTPGGALRMSELAAQTSLTPSGLTRSVDRLQEQGLVRRESCSEDRRGSFAVLTADGQALMDRAIPGHIAHVGEVLGKLFTPEEETALAELLRRLRDYVLEANGGCPSAEGETCPSAC
jgi:DNA-binding MarR family transcriptional regulator